MALQERLANVLASRKDKRCAELPLLSYAIAVHSIPTTASTSVDSVVDGNVQVHVAKHIEVCKMEDFGDSEVWREAMGRGAIKTFLEAHKEVFDLEEEVVSVVVRLRSSMHSTDQNQRSAASLPPFTAIVGVWRRSGQIHWDTSVVCLDTLKVLPRFGFTLWVSPVELRWTRNVQHLFIGGGICRISRPVSRCCPTFGIHHNWHRYT